MIVLSVALAMTLEHVAQRVIRDTASHCGAIPCTLEIDA